MEDGCWLFLSGCWETKCQPENASLKFKPGEILLNAIIVHGQNERIIPALKHSEVNEKFMILAGAACRL